MSDRIQRELGVLVRLSVPLVGAQLGSVGMWVVDVLMLGRVGVAELGAASLGRLVVMGTLVMGMGVLLGLDPLAAQAFGAGNERAFDRTRREAVVVAWLLTPVGLLVWLHTRDLLLAFGEDPALSELAHRYVVSQLWGLPFFLLFIIGRHLMQARGLMRPVLWAVLLGNGVNALGNWILIFGHLGMPALGIRGAGLSTAGTNVVMCFLVWSWVRRFVPRPAEVAAPFWRWRGVGRIVQLGIPVALQLGMEYWAFGICSLWSGLLGEVALASHTIAISLASVSFMVPLGVSIAAVTRVGNLLGADRREEAQRAAWVALGLGAGVMTGFAGLFVAARGVIPRLFTADAAVLALTAAVLPIAGAFQLFDGVQVVGGGILRGMGRTRPAAFFNLVAFYALGLPLAWWLAFRRGVGLPGIWWGLSLGLAVVAVLLVLWIRWRGPERVGGLSPEDSR